MLMYSMQTVTQHMTINCYQSEVTFLGFVLFRLFFFRTLHSSFQGLQIKLSFLNCNKKKLFSKGLILCTKSYCLCQHKQSHESTTL